MVTLLTTTSLRDSGLLDRLLPAFEKGGAYRVRAIVAGSGDAIAQARRGEGDLLLTHDPEAEARFVADGFGIERREVMSNRFLIAGPASDPAGLKGLALEAALRKLASAGIPFVSRGDRSGTHVMELALWRAARLAPQGAWYRETGQGQGLTLEVASQLGGYALTDEATFLVHRERLGLESLVEGDPTLRNVYAVTLVDPARFPAVQGAGAKALASWLVGLEARALIADFGSERYGKPLFEVAPDGR